jgi:phosphatidylinositol alpha-mannosyltransferase
MCSSGTGSSIASLIIRPSLRGSATRMGGLTTRRGAQRPPPLTGFAEMRVAIVCPYDLERPGGVQQHVLLLAEALRAMGDQVVTIGPGAAEGQHVDVGRGRGVRINGSVAPIAVGPRVARRTRLAIERFDPDVVHVHEPSVPSVSMAAARSSAPVVTTHHAWAEKAGVYGLLGPLLRGRVRAAAVRIAVSPAAASHHARALRLPTAAFSIVPNGVSVDRFASALPLDRLHGDAPVLLFVGRLEPRKGFEQAVTAFAYLKARHPDLRLVVVGDGPERERCQSLLPAGLRDDVDMLGRVSDADLCRVYASADIFVAPALGGESFGIVLLEAMAAGCAVVASDLPGFRSVVDDQVTARLVPPGDARAIASSVDALLSNPALRQAQIDAAREAVQAFDWPGVATRIRSVYATALEAAG